MSTEPRRNSLKKKTRGKKSRGTVTLKGYSTYGVCIQHLSKIPLPLPEIFFSLMNFI
jgi:hypothetical protein